MTYRTHLASNAVVLMSLAAVTDFNPISVNALLITCGSIAGTLAPDIDSPSSKINSILRVRKNANIDILTYNHRTSAPHWPLFALFVLFPIFFAPSMMHISIVVGAAIGVITHFFVDMLNPWGIMLFAPFSRTRFRLAKIPVGSKAENIFYWLCIVACVFLVLRFLLIK